MDYSSPGSTVHGILQARILEWVARPSCRGSSISEIKPASPISPALAGRFFTTSATWEALDYGHNWWKALTAGLWNPSLCLHPGHASSRGSEPMDDYDRDTKAALSRRFRNFWREQWLEDYPWFLPNSTIPSSFPLSFTRARPKSWSSVSPGVFLHFPSQMFP